MSAGDRGAARPHGGTGRRLGHGARALIWLLLAAGPAAAAPACRDDSAILQRADGTPIATFSVEIADDAAEREQGLMHRSALPKAAGMLFVYPSERPVAFWMHDTLIPLDILFLDGAGRVISVQADARPLDDTPLPSLGAAQYVLEINGGLARRLGIGAGAVLSHPAIAAGRAAIPCR